jgi:hypothetical protein
MGDLINFPTWFYEKERKLNELERDLAIQHYSIEREKYLVKAERSGVKGKILIAFSIGLIAGLSLGLLAFLI